MLQFAPKQAPKKTSQPKPDPSQPPPAVKKGVPKHILVSVSRMARYLGVDIRIIHGYIRRGALKRYYPANKPKIKHVYADECYMVVKRTALKKPDSKLNAVRPGALLSWNKGDGRREVGIVGPATESGLVDVMRTTHKPFMALIPDLEKAVVAKQIVIEEPMGVLKMVLQYLRLTNPTHPAIAHLEAAVREP